MDEQVQEEEEDSLHGSLIPSNNKESSEDSPAETFIFPHTRSRPSLLPAMPTLPEEDEDSPEDLDSSPSSPSTVSEHTVIIRSTFSVLCRSMWVHE